MISPTSFAVSSPTTSASSIGPIGIPKLTAVASITASGTPSCAANMASCRYGISTRLTRNPGALLHGTGSLSSRRAKPIALSMICGSVRGERTISINGICGTGLKKCSPTRRSGRASCSARGSSIRLEVFVASSALPFMRGSSRAYRLRFASRFSKIASMTTSARSTPSPATSALRRSLAAWFFAGSRNRLSNSSCERRNAGLICSRERSCSVTVKPRSAAQAAISPPITPAPTT